MVIFKTTVGYYDEDGKQVVLATGHAYEREGSSQINNTSFLENCVPLSAQILTDDGWKYYFQVKPGDKVLSINLETRKVEYCELQRVNVYKDHPILDLSTSRFHVRCTPEHKWITRLQSANFKDYQKIKTTELKVSDKIVQNIPQNVTPSDNGRRLGWLLCDCDFTYTKDGLPSTAHINQSKHIAEITAVWGEPQKKVKKYNEKWMDNYEWSIPADKVREVIGSYGIATYDDVPRAMLKAPIEDVAGCYEAMMLADGSERAFASTYRPLVDAVQIMCARLGIATSQITSRMKKNSTRPLYTLGIKKTDGACASELTVVNLPPQDVWCPTTANGTWFMRQGTFVTATSNCETSAIGRALGMLGIGIDTSVASAEEVANAIAQQKAMETPASPEKIEEIKKAYPPEKYEGIAVYFNKKSLEELTEAEANKVLAKARTRK